MRDDNSASTLDQQRWRILLLDYQISSPAGNIISLFLAEQFQIGHQDHGNVFLRYQIKKGAESLSF